jgi:hypothetical protein
MALKFDWWWMIPVVALAAWNKESFLLFIPTLYPLLRGRSSRINALVGTGVLGLICAAVYCVFRFKFQHNPGGTVEVHLKEQIAFWFHPLAWIAPHKTYGIVALPAFNPLSAALIVATVWRGWRSLPRTIQRHTQIAAVINFPLFILFCGAGELRNLSFLYIAFLLLLAVNLAKVPGNGISNAAALPG